MCMFCKQHKQLPLHSHLQLKSFTTLVANALDGLQQQHMQAAYSTHLLLASPATRFSDCLQRPASSTLHRSSHTKPQYDQVSLPRDTQRAVAQCQQQLQREAILPYHMSAVSLAILITYRLFHLILPGYRSCSVVLHRMLVVDPLAQADLPTPLTCVLMYLSGFWLLGLVPCVILGS